MVGLLLGRHHDDREEGEETADILVLFELEVFSEPAHVRAPVELEDEH